MINVLFGANFSLTESLQEELSVYFKTRYNRHAREVIRTQNWKSGYCTVYFSFLTNASQM